MFFRCLSLTWTISTAELLKRQANLPESIQSWPESLSIKFLTKVGKMSFVVYTLRILCSTGKSNVRKHFVFIIKNIQMKRNDLSLSCFSFDASEFIDFLFLSCDCARILHTGAAAVQTDLVQTYQLSCVKIETASVCCS